MSKNDDFLKEVNSKLEIMKENHCRKDSKSTGCKIFNLIVTMMFQLSEREKKHQKMLEKFDLEEFKTELSDFEKQNQANLKTAIQLLSDLDWEHRSRL